MQKRAKERSELADKAKGIVLSNPRTVDNHSTLASGRHATLATPPPPMSVQSILGHESAQIGFTRGEPSYADRSPQEEISRNSKKVVGILKKQAVQSSRHSLMSLNTNSSKWFKKTIKETQNQKSGQIGSLEGEPSHSEGLPRGKMSRKPGEDSGALEKPHKKSVRFNLPENYQTPTRVMFYIDRPRFPNRTCRFCKEVFETKMEYQIHLNTSQHMVKCRDCLLQFESPSVLARHIVDCCRVDTCTLF